MRNFQLPGRSPVRSTRGMAATSHPLATLAAVNMLQSGGNAMDAAVSAAAVQAVVEPQSTGIGGDCFVLFCPNGGDKVIAFNGSGRAPAAANIDWYRQRKFKSLPTFGVHSVTVPGAIDAWCRLLADHGKRGIDTALASAIYYAENGYVVHDRIAFDWAKATTQLKEDPNTARMFLAQGNPYRPGMLHLQPELARTLKLIARKGRKAFYEGAVADDIVNHLRSLGGLHTREDFAVTKGNYVAPVSTVYKGHRIHQQPPNNQGLTALLMLNILSGFDVASLDPMSAARLHLEIEVARLAYRDRDRFIADQDFVKVPVRQLLSPAYAEKLRHHINPRNAMRDLPDVQMGKSDTVYISVVDRDLNAVSFINSTYYSFGSGITGPKTGVVLQNRGASFKLDPTHPNALAPGKRPMHTIMPGMLTRGGKAVMPFGVMGGDFQPMGHVHLLTNIIDFGMDPQAALDAGRVFPENGKVSVEESVPSQSTAGLAKLGHKVARAKEPLGGGQSIWIDHKTGTLTGASDPRKDGCALGY